MIPGAGTRAAARPAATHRTRVKVCGLTRLEDARAALEAGADWLGFVVMGESPRAIAPERAAEIAAALPGAVTVAVMVAPTPEQAWRVAARCGASRLQLHRVEAAAWPADFPLSITFAVPVDATGRLVGAPPPEPHLLLLDTADAALAGGTGRTFPWQAAATLAAARPVMIAGGLGPDNVAEAIRCARPFGVDATSRLESAPGIKDPELLRRFVRAVRECDERLVRLA